MINGFLTMKQSGNMYFEEEDFQHESRGNGNLSKKVLKRGLFKIKAGET